MAEAMNVSIDKFKEKLNRSTEQQAKKKTDDSTQTKKELKKLQKTGKRDARISDGTKRRV